MSGHMTMWGLLFIFGQNSDFGHFWKFLDFFSKNQKFCHFSIFQQNVTSVRSNSIVKTPKHFIFIFLAYLQKMCFFGKKRSKKTPLAIFFSGKSTFGKLHTFLNDFHEKFYTGIHCPPKSYFHHSVSRTKYRFLNFRKNGAPCKDFGGPSSL